MSANINSYNYNNAGMRQLLRGSVALPMPSEIGHASKTTISRDLARTVLLDESFDVDEGGFNFFEDAFLTQTSRDTREVSIKVLMKMEGF